MRRYYVLNKKTKVLTVHDKPGVDSVARGTHKDAHAVHLQSVAAPLQDAALLPLLGAGWERIDVALRRH